MTEADREVMKPKTVGDDDDEVETRKAHADVTTAEKQKQVEDWEKDVDQQHEEKPLVHPLHVMYRRHCPRNLRLPARFFEPWAQQQCTVV